MPRLSFSEYEIKFRKTITRNLKPTERRDGRLNVGCEILKNYVDGVDSLEIIIIKNGRKKG